MVESADNKCHIGNGNEFVSYLDQVSSLDLLCHMAFQGSWPNLAKPHAQI